MNTTLKQIKALNIDLPLRIMSLVAKFGKGDGSSIPYPRATMIREFLGLSPKPTSQEVGKTFLVTNDLENRV